MGRASSRKKVARVARTGGAAGRGRAWMWPGMISLVVILGIVLIVASRGEKARDGDVPPRLNQDHWHQAFGVFVCGQFQPPTPEFHNIEGIHSHGDGLIHTHPSSSRATGERAVLGVFLKADGVDIDTSETTLELPTGEEFENGDKCPDGKEGKVQLVVRSLGETQGKVVAGDPNDFRLEENQVITLAFAPDGGDIPAPPSTSNLLAPSDVQGSQQSIPNISIPPADDPAARGDTTPPQDTTGATEPAPPGDTTAP